MNKLLLTAPVKEIVLRGNDPTGHGYFGAKRGNRSHNGLDLITVPGEDIFSPIDGVITKIGYPYSFELKFRYIEITNDYYRVWLMYSKPIPEVSVNNRVFRGEKVGIAQDISGYWGGGMMNHLHLQLWKYKLKTDPEPLLVNYFKPVE